MGGGWGWMEERIKGWSRGQFHGSKACNDTRSKEARETLITHATRHQPGRSTNACSNNTRSIHGEEETDLDAEDELLLVWAHGHHGVVVRVVLDGAGHRQALVAIHAPLRPRHDELLVESRGCVVMRPGKCASPHLNWYPSNTMHTTRTPPIHAHTIRTQTNARSPARRACRPWSGRTPRWPASSPAIGGRAPLSTVVVVVVDGA